MSVMGWLLKNEGKKQGSGDDQADIDSFLEGEIAAVTQGVFGSSEDIVGAAMKAQGLAERSRNDVVMIITDMRSQAEDLAKQHGTGPTVEQALIRHHSADKNDYTRRCVTAAVKVLFRNMPVSASQTPMPTSRPAPSPRPTFAQSTDGGGLQAALQDQGLSQADGPDVARVANALSAAFQKEFFADFASAILKTPLYMREEVEAQLRATFVMGATTMVRHDNRLFRVTSAAAGIVWHNFVASLPR